MKMFSKTNWKKQLKSERGISSVLVIFMMIVLVTFGAIALTSAYANIKLANKTLAWNQDYYALDSQAEQALAYIDQIIVLEQQGQLAQNSAGYTTLPDALRHLQSTQPNLLGEMAISANDGGGYRVQMEFNNQASIEKDSGEFIKYLTVVINTQPANGARYQVAEWREWQEAFNYEASQTEDLWDGDLTN